MPKKEVVFLLLLLTFETRLGLRIKELDVELVSDSEQNAQGKTIQSKITMNGKSVGPIHRGLNVAFVDYRTLVTQHFSSFDTHASSEASDALALILGRLGERHIVLMTCSEACRCQATSGLIAALENLGVPKTFMEDKDCISGIGTLALAAYTGPGGMSWENVIWRVQVGNPQSIKIKIPISDVEAFCTKPLGLQSEKSKTLLSAYYVDQTGERHEHDFSLCSPNSKAVTDVWYQVDLGYPRMVSGFETKMASQPHTYPVKYNFHYLDIKEKWRTVNATDLEAKVLQGQAFPMISWFPAIVASKINVTFLEVEGFSQEERVCMKAEVYGCDIGVQIVQNDGSLKESSYTTPQTFALDFRIWMTLSRKTWTTITWTSGSSSSELAKPSTSVHCIKSKASIIHFVDKRTRFIAGNIERQKESKQGIGTTTSLGSLKEGFYEVDLRVYLQAVNGGAGDTEAVISTLNVEMGNHFEIHGRLHYIKRSPIAKASLGLLAEFLDLPHKGQLQAHKFKVVHTSDSNRHCGWMKTKLYYNSFLLEKISAMPNIYMRVPVIKETITGIINIEMPKVELFVTQNTIFNYYVRRKPLLKYNATTSVVIDSWYNCNHEGLRNNTVFQQKILTVQIIARPEEPFYIRHSSGYCVAVNRANGALFLHNECKDLFVYTVNQRLLHLETKKCVRQSGIGNSGAVSLWSGCHFDETQLIASSSFELQFTTIKSCLTVIKEKTGAYVLEKLGWDKKCNDKEDYFYFEYDTKKRLVPSSEISFLYDGKANRFFICNRVFKIFRNKYKCLFSTNNGRSWKAIAHAEAILGIHKENSDMVVVQNGGTSMLMLKRGAVLRISADKWINERTSFATAVSISRVLDAHRANKTILNVTTTAGHVWRVHSTYLEIYMESTWKTRIVWKENTA